MNKPNWTNSELLKNSLRWRDLVDITADHGFRCRCNLCLEALGLRANLDLFSEEDMVTAVNEANEVTKTIIQPRNDFPTHCPHCRFNIKGFWELCREHTATYELHEKESKAFAQALKQENGESLQSEFSQITGAIK